MQPIDDTMLNTLEQLSRLRLNDAERQPMMTQLHRILDCFEQLNATIPDTDDPAESVQGSCPLREDIAVPFADVQSIIACAPRKKNNCVVVPKAVE